MSERDFFNEFMQLVQSGDEAAARKYLTDNFESFPEAVREEITFAFFAEALGKQAEQIGVSKAIQKQGTDALEILESATSELQNQARIDELQEGLSK